MNISEYKPGAFVKWLVGYESARVLSDTWGVHIKKLDVLVQDEIAMHGVAIDLLAACKAGLERMSEMDLAIHDEQGRGEYEEDVCVIQLRAAIAKAEPANESSNDGEAA